MVTQLFKDTRQPSEAFFRRAGFNELQTKTVTSAIDSFGYLVFEYVEQGRFEEAKALISALKDKTIAALESFDDMVSENMRERRKKV